MAGMKTDSGRNENFFGSFGLDFAVDVKSSTVEQNEISKVTTNCHAILIVHSHLPLLPLSFFFSAGATAAVIVMVSFFLYSLPRTPLRGYCCRTTSAPPYNLRPDSRQAACLCHQGAVQPMMQWASPPHQHASDQGGGTLIIGRTSIPWQLLSLSLSPSSPLLSPSSSLFAVADAVTITIAIVAGCCHCCQDNKSLMVFDISFDFLCTETGGCCQRLHHRTEGDGLGKLMAWEVAPGLAWRPALSWVLLHVGRGVDGHWYDGEQECAPPDFQVPSFLWALAFMCT